MPKSSKFFNTDRTKNREVTQFAPLELKINRHKKIIDVVLMDINGTDMFLEYNWLVKHNPEVNWDKKTIQFTKCLKECKVQH